MKFLVDMNLSPKWCEILQAEGWESVHWSDLFRDQVLTTILLVFFRWETLAQLAPVDLPA